MSETRPTDRPRISLEQLLKLKRSERPDAAFWEDFDRELRRRQLASVVATPTWRVRFARSLLVGVRRAVPVGAAAIAAIVGFLILQRPGEKAPASVEIATDGPLAPVGTVPAESPSPTITELAVTQSAPVVPTLVRPVTSKPRFVIHEFAATNRPARTYVSVTSPHTFSSSAYDASLQTVGTLSSGSLHRSSANPAAGNF